MRTLSLTSIVLLAASAHAGTAHFDSYGENVIGTSFTNGGITFSNLDNTFSLNASFVAEQADGTLTGMAGFSTPMCLGFSGWSPGPGAAFTRVKSFEMTTGQLENSGSLEIFEFGSYTGNSITLEAWNAGVVVASQTVPITPGFSVHHYSLSVGGVAFDHLRLIGIGPTDGGVFFGLVDEVSIGTSVFTSFCPGDGSQVACPCSNSGLTGRGCENSASTGGALLTASGTTTPDTLVLNASGELPTALSIFLQGNNTQTALPFGDGLRCITGVLKRLYVRSAVGGAVSCPSGTDLSVSAQSALLGDPIGPGSLRHYQTYYRDPSPVFCPTPTGSTFNVTDAISVQW